MQGKRLYTRFNYTEDDSVNFDDILRLGTPNGKHDNYEDIEAGGMVNEEA